ncbi:hypothetical protein C8R44DRAFT_752596 [Mycena epipterygia]|nr:hypothetical protein C8R44DRAFT_752596 [Mycena epipterygia]
MPLFGMGQTPPHIMHKYPICKDVNDAPEKDNESDVAGSVPSTSQNPTSTTTVTVVAGAGSRRSTRKRKGREELGDLSTALSACICGRSAAPKDDADRPNVVRCKWRAAKQNRPWSVRDDIFCLSRSPPSFGTQEPGNFKLRSSSQLLLHVEPTERRRPRSDSGLFRLRGSHGPSAVFGSPGRTLKIRNAYNVRMELSNETSIDLTLRCRDEDRSADIGVALKALYAYTPEELEDMVLGEVYCTAVGPLPVFMRLQVDRVRRRRVARSELDNDKPTEKAKTRPLLGSMVLVNPISRIPGQQPAVLVADTMLYSLQNKLYPPLNWFTNDRLLKIQHCQHELHTKLIRPEPSLDFPNPDKVLAFDMLKMEALWGSDDDYSCLTPLKWQESALNLESALILLCGPLTDGPATKPTHASEFHKHRLFFLNYAKFEENYSVWYAFEREARHDILKGHLFDADYYARQVDGRLHAKAAVELYSPSSRRQDRDPDVRLSKVPRQTNDSPSSFRGDRGTDSFRGAERDSFCSGTACACCAGPHKLRDHTATATTFGDGKPCFTMYRDAALWTIKPFRGSQTQRICVDYNLPSGCRRLHDPKARLHICSFCGREHPAIPFNSSCGRSPDTGRA